MAQEIISVGSTPNDNTGDTLRDAFIKTNSNFTELYTDPTVVRNNSDQTIAGSLDATDLKINGESVNASIWSRTFLLMGS